MVVPVVLAAILLAVIVFLGANPTRTIAQDTPPEPQAELDAIGWFSCTIVAIAAFDDRIHVRCSNTPGSGVYWFAAASTYPNELLANRYLTLLNTAYALKSSVDIYWDSDSTHNPPGCLTGDCRKMVGLKVVK
ncbi:MAG: hypothetical protein WC837_13285 [Bellilinea sp.]